MAEAISNWFHEETSRKLECQGESFYALQRISDELSETILILILPGLGFLEDSAKWCYKVERCCFPG